jgi:hypothetical protein
MRAQGVGDLGFGSEREIGMKLAICEVFGKRISGVIVKEGPPGRTPNSQVFLLFADDTYYELYSDGPIQGCSELGHGGPKQVKAYMNDTMDVVLDEKQERGLLASLRWFAGLLFGCALVACAFWAIGPSAATVTAVSTMVVREWLRKLGFC